MTELAQTESYDFEDTEALFHALSAPLAHLRSSLGPRSLSSAIRSLPIGVCVTGRLALAGVGSDMDLATFGKRVDGFRNNRGVVTVRVAGRSIRMAKANLSIGHVDVSIIALPPSWFLDQCGEYLNAHLLLRSLPGRHAIDRWVECHRADKVEAYGMVGVRVNTSRPPPHEINAALLREAVSKAAALNFSVSQEQGLAILQEGAAAHVAE